MAIETARYIILKHGYDTKEGATASVYNNKKADWDSSKYPEYKLFEHRTNDEGVTFAEYHKVGSEA